MQSSRDRTSPRRKAFLALAGQIESQLREVFARKVELEGLTQTQVASRLGIGKSVVNRRLSGRQNMTVESIADMAWALDHCVDIKLFDPKQERNNQASAVFLGEPSQPDMSAVHQRSAGTWASNRSKIIGPDVLHEPA